MFRYLVIESAMSIKSNESTLVSLFSDLMHIDKIETFENYIVIYFHGELDLSFQDIIINLSSDILTELRLFESYRFKTEKDRDINQAYMIEILKKIAIAKYAYLNEQIILSLMINKLDVSYVPGFLKSFTNNQMMINSIRVYLESSQNTSEAAKQLFIHRNTLIQRIDKFIDETGFDIRQFLPGYYVYQLINKS